MSLDKLGLYNDALLLIGDRPLATLTDTQESRRVLDNAFDFGAIDYCLELIQPVFAKKTANLTTSVVSTSHDLDNVFTLPSDWITTVNIFSDSRLDQKIARYINEDRTIACEFAAIFVRYVSNTNATTYTKWSPAFADAVSAYLAKKISVRLAPDRYAEMDALFTERAKIAIDIERAKEPAERAKKLTTTLSQAWLNIYNDALLILGLTKITNNDDDSHRRSVLDTAIDGDLVEYLFEDIAWNWGITSTKIEADPSIEPDWGWKFGFGKPADMHRLDGVFVDEYFQRPLKSYIDEDDFFFSDVNVIYLKFVSKALIGNPDAWEPSFKKLVAARLAKETCMTLAPDKYMVVKEEFDDRDKNAKSNDAMQSPPRLIAEGSWVMSRNAGRTNRRRP